MIGINLTGYKGAMEKGCPVPNWVFGSNHKELYIVVYKVRMAGRCDESVELWSTSLSHKQHLIFI